MLNLIKSLNWYKNTFFRACPECRVTSDFVCPSMYWVDTKEEKQKLIDDYKCALARKDCKYFKQGRGKCPFGNKCFYLHALPDGTKRDVGPPPRQPRRQNHEGDIDVLQVLAQFLSIGLLRWSDILILALLPYFITNICFCSITGFYFMLDVMHIMHIEKGYKLYRQIIQKKKKNL